VRESNFEKSEHSEYPGKTWYWFGKGGYFDQKGQINRLSKEIIRAMICIRVI